MPVNQVLEFREGQLYSESDLPRIRQVLTGLTLTPMTLMNLQKMNQLNVSVWADKLSSEPKQRGSTGITVLELAVMLVLSTLSAVPSAAISSDRMTNANERDAHEFRLLQHYRLVYAEEPNLFAYCVAKYREKSESSYPAPFEGLAIGSKVGRCMKKQIKIKNRILKLAERELGDRSLAQDIYDECTSYYPRSGAARTGDCVKTRLELDRRLDDDVVENKIYRKCDRKWRKHGADAIDNCSITGANYYRNKGQLRD